MKLTSFLRASLAAATVATAFAFAPAEQTFAKPSTYSTGFQVANLSSSVANITMTFYVQDTATPSATVNATIPANGSVTYATLPSQVAAGFSGSAVISSDQKVAAIVNVIGDNLAFGGGAYNGFTAGSASVSLPLLFKSSFGFDTFFNVQNTGTAAATVTITYRGGGLTQPRTEQASIPPGAAKRFDQATNANLPSGFNGSASISSNQPVVASVVQAGPTTILDYNGFTKASKNPIMPLVQANNFGYITGISLQNAGTVASNVTVSYTPSPGQGTACTETLNIPAGGSQFFALNSFSATDSTPSDDNCANGVTFVGSARVTANSGNTDLVAIVNQLNSPAKKGGSYSSFDALDATSTIVAPLVQDRYFNFFTGINIVNLSATATTVNCTFSGTSKTQGGNIPANGTLTLVQSGAIQANYNGSGVCTATGGAKIIGVVNQVNTTSTADQFFVYEAINN